MLVEWSERQINKAVIMKSTLHKLFGYRWSLYICINDKEMKYKMHNDSLLRMIGYIMNYFIKFGNPKTPWSIWLNFNKTNTSFELKREHFTDDGDSVSKLFVKIVKSIDPDYIRTGSEPIVIDVNTKRKIHASPENFSKFLNPQLQWFIMLFLKCDFLV